MGRVWSSRGAQQGVARYTHAGLWLDSNLFVTLPQASLTGLAHLYNLISYQRRAQHAGQYGVAVEGGTVPTRDAQFLAVCSSSK